MNQIERYNIFEFNITGPKPINSNVKVDFIAIFNKGDRKVKVKGFYNGDSKYSVRFMPDELGIWEYELSFKGSKEVREKGNFECIKETGKNHGPVVADGMKFQYADGETFIPIGTTIYAWIHQPDQLIKKTIQTLSNSPFNKVRMCVFPKSMEYNNNEPELFPFEKNSEGKWDVNQPNFKFWQHLEKQLKVLLDLGIEADLILFHPYDRWGFADLSREDSLIYLDYCVRRLSAFRNIWWSLANEYELIFSKNEDDWETFGEFINSEDSYHHLISIHNWLKPYDASKSWITHCSIQTFQYEKTKQLRDEYKKPVMIDECGYEGDIEYKWGNISSFELIHRFWSVMVLGGYCTHGETFHRDDEILWWSKGGELHGESVKRIAFLKEIMYGLEGEIQPDQSEFANPNNMNSTEDEPLAADHKNNPYVKVINSLNPEELYHLMAGLQPYSGRHDDKYIIQYFGRECRAFCDIALPEDRGEYSIEVIDIWEMSRVRVLTRAKGKTRIELPGKEGIAVIATQS